MGLIGRMSTRIYMVSRKPHESTPTVRNGGFVLRAQYAPIEPVECMQGVRTEIIRRRSVQHAVSRTRISEGFVARIGTQDAIPNRREIGKCYVQWRCGDRGTGGRVRVEGGDAIKDLLLPGVT